MKIPIYLWGNKYLKDVEFRRDPIPGTKGSRRCYAWWRHMKTTQEIRSNCDPDYKLYIRGRRKNIPNCWDDVHRGCQRSWKSQNRHLTQYKKIIDM